jgi:selenocysteine-specific elongation factor
MPESGLRAPLAKAATVGNFAALLAHLEAEGVLVSEGALGVRLPEHDVTIPPGWQKAADALLDAVRRGGLQPPPPDFLQRDYPRDVNVLVIFNILAEQGALVRVAEDLFFSREAMDEVKTAIRRLAQTPEGITVGTVRDATGSSRRYILPLLEYLDAQRFTRRQGDARVLVEPAPTA